MAGRGTAYVSASIVEEEPLSTLAERGDDVSTGSEVPAAEVTEPKTRVGASILILGGRGDLREFEVVVAVLGVGEDGRDPVDCCAPAAAEAPVSTSEMELTSAATDEPVVINLLIGRLARVACPSR